MNKKEIENTTLKEVVTEENKLKEMLVQYVGLKMEPEDGQVTVEMIVECMSQEFPEFLMVVAEENWVRGYKQGISDLRMGPKIDVGN